MKFLVQFAACLSMLAGSAVHADGDAAAGQGKAAICAACHGIDGNSSVPNWPKIAGQHASYLERQLELITDGSRPVPEMAGIVAALDGQDRADLAAYFASQAVTPGITDAGMRVSGERLYRAGNVETEVPACMACHGPAGEGNPLSAYPSLAGQHAAYTEKMLKGYRAGGTWGDEDSASTIMTEVALRLTDTEIKAVSSYIQGLHAVDITSE